jgi:hypothetical protein
MADLLCSEDLKTISAEAEFAEMDKERELKKW